MNTAIETKLIIGCGYLGSRVAERWLAAGHEVHALTRSDERAIELEEQGIHALVGDVADPQSLPQLTPADTVLFCVGYDNPEGRPIEDVYVRGIRNVLEMLPVATPRFIYISSTGVYGDAGGGVVDEQTPPAPARPGGKAAFDAERVLAEYPLGRRGVVLRLAGIYGPDRIPYIRQLEAGEPIAAPREGWLNLIHVDDGASAVLATESWLDRAAADSGPHIFNVCDGSPVVRGDYYREVARLIGAAAPTFADPPPDSPAAARASTNKRVSNEKMIGALGAELTYPNYRQGLSAVLAEG